MNLPIYLDYNATTPVDPAVLDALLPYFSKKFGNAASSTHAYGWIANDAVERARLRIANLLNCEEQQLVFTSGSTEAINLAIKGVWGVYSPRKGKHIITSKTEHKAVLDVCKYLESKGARVTYLDVDKNGLVDLDQLRSTITDETILVSIMYANNETGVIQPMWEIADIVHEKGGIFMSDATQAIGKVGVDIDETGIDLLCLSGHKFYGPKGIGALFYRRKKPRVALEALIHGGGHQRGLRSGTLNVPAIVGLGKAAELARDNWPEFKEVIGSLRDEFERKLAEFPDIIINGKNAVRLPNTSSIIFKGIKASRLIELTKGVIAVSTGSACTSEVMEPSHVLSAMGLTEEECYASIRFSLGRYTTEDDINHTLGILKERLAQK